MRILVLANARSGTSRRRARVEAVAARLAGDGADVRVEVPASAERLRERAAAATRRDHDVVLVAGGDGTLHEAVNGLVRVARDDRPPLCVLPVGRGNDFAAGLGIRSSKDALRALAAGRSRWVDLGGSDAGVFLSVAGAGFDARVARRAQETPLLAGSLLYSYAVLRTLADFRPLEARLRWQDGTYEGPIVFAAVGNGTRYGGGMHITPRASLEDGRLDLCLVLPISRRTLVYMFPKVFSGRHLDHPQVRYHSSAFVEIETDEPAEIFADGELLQSTPARLEALPAELEVLVPS